jgi:hypothetical protein
MGITLLLGCLHIACRCVLPIGALFAVVLWTGNAAFLYLSVSFVQMMKVRQQQQQQQRQVDME